MTKYWARVYIPGWDASVEAINQAFFHTLSPSVSWNYLPMSRFFEVADKTVSAFAAAGFTIESASIVQIKGRGLIHVDDVSDIEARINIPLLNCDQSFTTFYETTDKTPVTYQTHVKFYVPDETKCRMVDAVVLSQPTVLRVSEPHRVICRTTAPRCSLTLRVSPDPVYLLQPLK